MIGCKKLIKNTIIYRRKMVGQRKSNGYIETIYWNTKLKIKYFRFVNIINHKPKKIKYKKI